MQVRKPGNIPHCQTSGNSICPCRLQNVDQRPGVPPAVDLAVAEEHLTANWANVDLALSVGRLDAGALERCVSVAGVIQLSST